MTLNNHHQPPPTTAPTTATCAICKSDDHWILHNHIEPRTTTNPKKICTCCYLKLYPTSFCPTCYNLHDCNSLTPPQVLSSSSNNRFLTCLKCNSISHLTCVPANTPKSPYLCPPCSNPNFNFFNVKKSQILSSAAVDGGAGGGGSGEGELKKVDQVMDEKGARVLLLAAKMSGIVMNKAAGTARSEAERKVKEAALARKRAKEAIDHVMMLSSKLMNAKHRGGGGGGGDEESEEEKKMRVRKELEKVAKEQAERRATAQLMYELGQKAYGRGMYARAVEFFEAALTIIARPTLFGGEIQIWLAMAYEADNRHADCIALYEKLEKGHPSVSIRRQAAELSYILQAPKIKITQEEMVTIPLIGSAYDSYASTWTDKSKNKEQVIGAPSSPFLSSRDYIGDFLKWKPPVGLENNRVFWAAVTLWLGLIGAAIFLQK